MVDDRVFVLGFGHGFLSFNVEFDLCRALNEDIQPFNSSWVWRRSKISLYNCILFTNLWLINLNQNMTIDITLYYLLYSSKVYSKTTSFAVEIVYLKVYLKKSKIT